MSTLIRCYPGDRGIEFLLVVTLAVVLASSTAWFISGRLAGNGALRHLVLLAALVCCLASPAAAWFCGATGLRLVSIPLFCGGNAGNAVASKADVDKRSETVSIFTCAPTRQSIDPPRDVAEASLPQARESIGFLSPPADASVEAVTNYNAAISVPTALGCPSLDSPTEQASVRVIFSGGVIAWIVGALLLFVRLAANCTRVLRLRRASRVVELHPAQSWLEHFAANLGMRPIPQLLKSSRSIIPLAVGFGRPAVILPERLLSAASDDELRDILLHELAHLRRGDQWIVLLQELAGILYWPVLPIHAMNRELQRAREETCDNVVLAKRSAVSYGETLLHIAELLLQARPMRAAVGILGGQGELERRIAGLIDPRRNPSTSSGRRATCIVLFLFIALGMGASATRLATLANAADASSDTAAGAVLPSSKKSLPAQSKDNQSAAQQAGLAVADPNDPQLAGRFGGRVIGPDGKAVRGARVYVAPLSDGLDGKLAFAADARGLAVRAKTDADGRFEFDARDMTLPDLDSLPTRRKCLVIATADGYAPDWATVRGRTRSTTIVDPTTATNLALQLGTNDVPIHGRFLDFEGRPLAGARVQVTAIMFPRERNLDAHLEREIKGSILGCSTSNENALYQAHLLPELITETRTDADGRFTLSGIGRDRLVVLKVTAPSMLDTSLTVMTRESPDVRIRLGDGKSFINTGYTPMIYGAGFTLPLNRGRTIIGMVRDRDTHKPLPGMWVGVRNRNAPPTIGASGYYSTPTDANGRFTITGLYPARKRQKTDDPNREREAVLALAAPGMPYQGASAVVLEDAEVLIECARGIPFRLKLVDEQRRPVEADVVYKYVHPNPDIESLGADASYTATSQAARNADGTYSGFVLPGPGAVLVTTPNGANFVPASVDPAAFFSPGQTDQSLTGAYGTPDKLIVNGGAVDQSDYAAIVLVNPKADSGPLELSATVAKGRPRRVTLLDPEDKPVVGVKTQGMTAFEYDHEPPLRAATFTLTRLHPDRVRRITFSDEKRQLIGFLAARGDGDASYTVRMQAWGTVTGRIVDDNGKPLTANLSSPSPNAGYRLDPEVGAFWPLKTENDGRFRIEKLVPGLRYSALIYREAGKFSGVAFDNLVLRPGEVRDLGDVRITPAQIAMLESAAE